MTGKLIVQKAEQLYVYYEGDDHFRKVEGGRACDYQRLPTSYLDDNCDTSDWPDNSYMVFDLEGRSLTPTSMS